jgi:hypothetical protein
VAAHTSTKMPRTMPNNPDHRQAERQDKFRIEKAKTEVKLLTSNATDDMKKELTGMIEEDLIKILSNASGCDIRGVRKLANYGRKIQCKTEEEVEMLRNAPWGNVIEGVTVVKTTFDFVCMAWINTISTLIKTIERSLRLKLNA